MSRDEQIRGKLRRPFPMRGIERKIYAAVLLALLLGLVWSISARDWQYFERSGSLLIIIGVGLAWHDHVNLLGKMEHFYRTEFARLLAAFDSQRPTGIIAGAVHDGDRAKLEEATLDLQELIRMLKRRVRTTEAVIVSLGPVIWGYGSIIGEALWSFR